ncbi:MAG: sigma-70 family RNA polymerase sigma factor [Planctomycetales bacterium]|nr:sigma-70 family RNA polymerase sigma factor [Planctomycetales bacterium]
MTDQLQEDVESDDHFRDLIAEVAQGSDVAVWEVIRSYEPHIRRVVRRRLNGQLRSKFDTMDFVQMVWKSFFYDPLRLCSFNNPRHFVAFLVKMALHKVDSEHRRRLDTRKYDVQREQPWSDEHGPVAHDSPSQIAMAQEHWDQLLRRLPPHHREVVRLRLEGLTHHQIAERLRLHERTTRQILKDLLLAVSIA